MKVEPTNPLKNLPETVYIAQKIPPFQKGEVVKAAVLSQYGESIMFRTADGKVFTARALADFLFSEKDVVAFSVKERTPSRLVLQVLSVEKEALKPAVQSVLEGMGLEGDRDAARIVQRYIETGIKPTPQNVRDALNVLNGLQVDAKAAVFFASNNVPATQSNAQAYASIVSGKTAGRELYELAAELLSPSEEGLPTDAMNREAPQENGGAAGRAAQTQPAREPAGKALPEMTAPQENAAAKAGHEAATGVMPRTQPDAAVPQKPLAIPRPPDTFAQNEASAQPQRDAAAPQKPPGMFSPGMFTPEEETPRLPQAVTPQPWQPRDIAERILSLFVRLLESPGGEEIKEAPRLMLRHMTALKETLQKTDIDGKEAMGEKLANIASQFSLTEDINRFVCLYIPVAHRGYETAELYVYKRKKRGGKIDPDNTVLLIALMTQRFGRVETLVRVENRGISLTFRVENEEEAGVFKEHTAALRKTLSEINYQLKDVQVAGLAERTTAENATEVLDAAAHGARQTIDYRI